MAQASLRGANEGWQQDAKMGVNAHQRLSWTFPEELPSDMMDDKVVLIEPHFPVGQVFDCPAEVR